MKIPVQLSPILTNIFLIGADLSPVIPNLTHIPPYLWTMRLIVVHLMQVMVAHHMVKFLVGCSTFSPLIGKARSTQNQQGTCSNEAPPNHCSESAHRNPPLFFKVFISL
jgi:hypothetical protein